MTAGYPLLGEAFEELPTAGNWEVYVLRTGGFPMPRRDKRAWRIYLDQLSRAIATEHRLAVDVFLEFSQLHRGGGAETLRRYAKDWMPEVGLGVDPGKPPRLWSPEDFESLAPGEVMPPLIDQVLRMTAHSEARRTAFNRMCGNGACIQILAQGEGDAPLPKRSHLAAETLEPAFRDYPFYLPLLDAKWVASASRELLDVSLSGVKLYLRESALDGCVLLLSAVPLRKFLYSAAQEQTLAPALS